MLRSPWSGRYCTRSGRGWAAFGRRGKGSGGGDGRPPAAAPPSDLGAADDHVAHGGGEAAGVRKAARGGEAPGVSSTRVEGRSSMR